MKKITKNEKATEKKTSKQKERNERREKRAIMSENNIKAKNKRTRNCSLSFG